MTSRGESRPSKNFIGEVAAPLIAKRILDHDPGRRQLRLNEEHRERITFACIRDQRFHEEFPNFMFFDSNGGLELIAIDLRSGPPWPIVMIDPVAGPDSAEQIAPDVLTFIEAIGLESKA